MKDGWTTIQVYFDSCWARFAHTRYKSYAVWMKSPSVGIAYVYNAELRNGYTIISIYNNHLVLLLLLLLYTCI